MRGWSRVPMGDLCTITSGKSNTKDAVEGGQFAFFDRSKTPKQSSRYLYDKEALIIPGEGTEFTPRHFTGKFDLHQRAYALFDFSADIDVRYLYYYLIYFKDWFVREAVGATVKSLRRRHFTELPVVVAPVAEQKRIVAILDEAFAGIDAAVTNAEKNLANARELFASYLELFFAEQASSSPRRELAELCEPDRVITYGVVKLGGNVVDGVPCLRTSNVRWLRIDKDDVKRISPAISAQYGRTVLRGGEVLVNVRGTLGGVAVASKDLEGWNVSREVAVVPVDKAAVSPAFVSYWIGTQASQSWLSSVKKGLAYVGINIKDLRTLPVPVPPAEQQVRIVERAEWLQADTHRLEYQYRQRLCNLHDLRESLLQKAFSGKLTAKEAEKEMAAA
jgi:type I restriction enzyme, S subunit